jgi:DnaK suppressor protein
MIPVASRAMQATHNCGEAGEVRMLRQSKELEELRKVREHTLLDIERLRDELHAEIEPASATDDDSADVAADIYERGKVLSLIQSMESKLHSLDDAIARASKGMYGICQMCGEEIAPERLAVMPETTYCVRCASKVEQGIRRQKIIIADEEQQTEDYDDEEDLEEEGDDYGDDL